MNTRNTNHRSFRPFALALVLGLAGAAQALASEPSIKVSYSDLDLSTPAGAQTLYHRISGAARTVCGFEGADLIEQQVWKACYRGAVADAVAKVNSPLLTAVASGKSVSTTVAMIGK